MSIKEFVGDILFVIVLYKKKPEESAAFRSVQKIDGSLTPDSLFIYDNTCEPVLTEIAATYRHDPANSGVSRAYNEACRLALNWQKKWLLLFDQDTAFENSFIQDLFLITGQHPRSRVFVPILEDEKGIVSPFRWSYGKGKRIKVVAGKLPLRKFRFANSGLLIGTDSFFEVNGYEESIPLDFSDIAFGEKLCRITDHFIVVNTKLTHSFSGSISLPEGDALERFNHFCNGAFAMGKTFGDGYLYFVRALIRAVNLMILYRNNGFIKIFLQRARNNS